MEKFGKWFDYLLLVFLAVFLIFHYTHLLDPYDDQVLFYLALIGTAPVFVSALMALKNRELSIDLLASIALIASIWAKEWPSAVFINLMLDSARIFDRYTQNQARLAIQSLLKLRPEKVKIKQGTGVTEVDVEQVKVGDIVLVESGGRVPIDGIVESGNASIDQSSLTGESVPVEKKKGDRVFSATLNVSGTLEVKTEKVGKDTTLAKIVKMVEQSEESKAGIHTIADTFASWYIAIAFIGAAATYYVTRDLNFVLALLLVACADDIAVAIPLAFTAAIGVAARQGIIIKGGDFVEGLTKLKTVLLDKTGTLTAGKLKVQTVVSFENVSSHQLLEYAASAECFSDHPAAKAITEYVNENKIVCDSSGDFNEVPGKGSTATYKGKKVICGKLSFIKENNIVMTLHQESDLETAKNKGLNITLVSYDGHLAGFIGLADQLRPEIKESIKELKSLGVTKLVMLTGDNEKVAKKIADEAGIIDYHANLLPEDKLKYIKAELNNKTKVGMVGDGVNDAASLALADIGIAMGVIGSDAAIESADIALMKDDISKIPLAIRLGKYTMHVAHQDFAIWGVTNAVGFFLVISHIIGPSGAAAFNFGTDFLPFFNSLRLFRLHKSLVF